MSATLRWVSLFAVAITTAGASFGSTISVAVGYGANSGGNSNGLIWSSTACCEGAWLAQGTTGGSFVSNSLSANLNFTLNPGTLTLYMFMNGNATVSQNGAVNLFLNGNTTTPRISVFAPATNASGTFPSFSADSGACTLNGSSGCVTGSGSLSYDDGTNTITLTNFQWANSGAYSLNRVGNSAIGADASNDNIALLTLAITADQVATPEPGAVLLLSSGLAGLVFLRRRLQTQS